MQFGGERAARLHVRQQYETRQIRITGNMSEPGGDDLLGSLTFDQRCAERRIGMRPSDQYRQAQAVALWLDTPRKKAQQLARAGTRPNQYSAGVAAEHT